MIDPDMSREAFLSAFFYKTIDFSLICIYNILNLYLERILL